MEEWNARILGIRAEINHFNCKKLLSFNFVQDKLTHHFYPACPACPVAPADGTGVGPADLTGVKLFSISPGPLLHHSTIPIGAKPLSSCLFDIDFFHSNRLRVKVGQPIFISPMHCFQVFLYRNSSIDFRVFKGFIIRKILMHDVHIG
jgi:hypothetical protein